MSGLNDGSRKNNPFTNAFIVGNLLELFVNGWHVRDFLEDNTDLVEFDKILKGNNFLRGGEVLLKVE